MHTSSHESQSCTPVPPRSRHPLPPPATRVSQWSVFLDQYDGHRLPTSAATSSLLLAVRDLATQLRLADDIEQDIYDG